MQRLNKPFESITNLTIIYLSLVTVSIALYALIQIYVSDKDTAVGLLGWTATLFATIALLYTFNSWSKQKEIEVIANEAKQAIYNIYILSELQKKITNSSSYKDFIDLALLFDRECNELRKRLDFIANQDKLKNVDVLCALADFSIACIPLTNIKDKEIEYLKDKISKIYLKSYDLKNILYPYALYKKVSKSA